MPNPSRAGSRTKRFRSGYGRLNDSHIMILRTGTTGMLALSAYDNDALNQAEKFDLDAEGGMAYVLNIYLPGRQRPVMWNFSGMTTEELEVTRQFFNDLFDLADPVVRERDRIANAAYEEGDDSFARIYRPVPQFVKREGKIREHRSSVQLGSEDPSQGDRDELDPRGGVSGDSSELADSQSQEDGIQDDRSQAD